jgi:hypothetical protein
VELGGPVSLEAFQEDGHDTRDQVGFSCWNKLSLLILTGERGTDQVAAFPQKICDLAKLNAIGVKHNKGIESLMGIMKSRVISKRCVDFEFPKFG